jgi:cell division septation protein DedD
MSLHLDDDYDEPTPRHTELTLSTGVLIGGLFGLVLLCALFFGLGYSMHGHRPAAAALPAASPAEPVTPSDTFSNFKPAAGSPLHPESAASSAPPPAKNTAAASQPAPVVARPAVVPVAAAAPNQAATTPSTGFYVQVAAISHQQEADKLAGTLHAEGYLVTSRTSPQDALFHVQIGPYATRRDADLIRQKLIGEGYTPIVK